MIQEDLFTTSCWQIAGNANLLGEKWTTWPSWYHDVKWCRSLAGWKWWSWWPPAMMIMVITLIPLVGPLYHVCPPFRWNVFLVLRTTVFLNENIKFSNKLMIFRTEPFFVKASQRLSFSKKSWYMIVNQEFQNGSKKAVTLTLQKRVA